MTRKMEATYALEVYVNESNNICIKQEDPMQEDSVVVLNPSQVDWLVQQLTGVKSELQGN